MHDGQMPRPRHANGTRSSSPQVRQAVRTNPRAKSPQPANPSSSARLAPRPGRAHDAGGRDELGRIARRHRRRRRRGDTTVRRRVGMEHAPRRALRRQARVRHACDRPPERVAPAPAPVRAEHPPAVSGVGDDPLPMLGLLMLLTPRRRRALPAALHPSPAAVHGGRACSTRELPQDECARVARGAARGRPRLVLAGPSAPPPAVREGRQHPLESHVRRGSTRSNSWAR